MFISLEGGSFGALCPHSVCYGLKWIFRAEGVRDHINMLLLPMQGGGKSARLVQAKF